MYCNDGLLIGKRCSLHEQLIGKRCSLIGRGTGFESRDNHVNITCNRLAADAIKRCVH